MQTIIRTLKLKTPGDISASDNHCRRLSQVENADPDRSRYNFEYMANNLLQEQLARDRQSISERVASIEVDRGIITPRKDSVKCVEIVMAAPPELFKGKTAEQLGEGEKLFGAPIKGVSKDRQFEQWSYANYCFAKRHFSDVRDYSNVVSMKVHLDETTPHIHIHVMPVHQGRYNCKHYLGGSMKMQALQDAYHATMKDFMPQIDWERGQKKAITGKDHQTVKDWYQKLATIDELGVGRVIDQFIKETLEKARNESKSVRQQVHEVIADIEQQGRQVKTEAEKVTSQEEPQQDTKEAKKQRNQDLGMSM